MRYSPCYEIFFLDLKLFEVFVGRHSRSNGYSVLKDRRVIEIYLGTLYVELSTKPKYPKR